MTNDNRQLGWLIGYQRGVLTRAQAIAKGMTEEELRHRLRPGGPWRRLLPGIYITLTGVPTLEQLQVAAILYAGPASAITGLAAVQHHGLLVPKIQKIDVAVPLRRRRADRDFVALHRTRRMPEPVACAGPIRFALPARAVADAVRGMTNLVDARAVVASAVQKGKCAVPQLLAEVRADPAHGSTMLRGILAEVADGARSVAEGDFRELILASGLPRPLFNATLRLNGEFLAIADAWWPEAGLAVEIDSREWHLSPADWERTMQRHGRMTAAGIRVLHVTPRQVRYEGSHQLQLIGTALATGQPVRGITWEPAAA